MKQVAHLSCVTVLRLSRVSKLRTLPAANRGGSEQRNLKMILVAMLPCGWASCPQHVLCAKCCMKYCSSWWCESWWMLRCLQAALTTPSQTTALLRLWAPPKHQYNVIEGATKNRATSLAGAARSACMFVCWSCRFVCWTCMLVCTEGCQHSRTSTELGIKTRREQRSMSCEVNDTRSQK